MPKCPLCLSEALPNGFGEPFVCTICFRLTCHWDGRFIPHPVDAEDGELIRWFCRDCLLDAIDPLPIATA